MVPVANEWSVTQTSGDCSLTPINIRECKCSRVEWKILAFPKEEYNDIVMRLMLHEVLEDVDFQYSCGELDITEYFLQSIQNWFPCSCCHIINQ